MGYIEDRQAEGARQAFEAAKKAEAARILDQNVGLAARGISLGSVADVPLELSHEQVANLVLQNRAREAEQADTNRAVEEMIAKNREYNLARNNVKNAPLKYSTNIDPRTGTSLSTPYREYSKEDLETVNRYKDSIDPGLAAKWMSNYRGK